MCNKDHETFRRFSNLEKKVNSDRKHHHLYCAQHISVFLNEVKSTLVMETVLGFRYRFHRVSILAS